MASRSRKLIFVGAAILSILAGCLCFLVVHTMRTKGGVESRLQAIRAAGFPTNIAELQPEPIADDQNAAALLEAVYPTVDAAADAVGKLSDAASGGACDAAMNERQRELQEFMDGRVELVAELRKALAAPQYAPVHKVKAPANAFLANQIQKSDNFAAALRTISLIIQADEKSAGADNALNEWLDVLTLIRGFETEPTLVCQLRAQAYFIRTASAIADLLRSHTFEPATYERLQSELASLDSLDALVNALAMERAFGMEQYEELIQVSSPALRGVGRLIWGEDAIRYLQLADEQMKLATRPYFEVQAEYTVSPNGAGTAMSDLVRPAMVSAREAFERRRAVLRCLRVLACINERRLPDATEVSLESLGLPPEAITDPFTGEMLKLKRGEVGWIVYSVGKDRTDDGGDIEGADVGME